MSEEFVDLSGVDLEDTFEPTVKKKGEECKLRIVSCLVDTDKNGNRYIMPFFEDPDDPYLKEFGDFMSLPHDGMSPKDANKAKLRLKGFAEAFDVDFSGALDIKNDLVGKTGWAILGVGKDQDGQPVNRVNKYVTGA